jgi:alpha-amylase
MTRTMRHRGGSLFLTTACLLFGIAGCGGDELGAGSQRSPYDDPGPGYTAPDPGTSPGDDTTTSTDTGSSPDLPRNDHDGVLMQAFYWDVPKATDGIHWWKNLADKAPELGKAGITAVWIPPPYKGFYGDSDVGYGVYDRYDLGEFDQKGTVGTRYGTLAELTDAITALHDNGVRVYVDMVMNHMMGGDEKEPVKTLAGEDTQVSTRFTFGGRGGAYDGFEWNSTRFNGCKVSEAWKQWHAWDFEPSADGSAYDNLLGCEIRYSDPDVRAATIAWGKWLTEKLGIDGYRIDAAKHMLTPFVNQWLDEVKGERFAVSEAWWGDVGQLLKYAEETGGRTHLFDVPLHYRFHEMSDGDGDFDMQKLRFAGFAEKKGGLAVTFVDNHDTDAPSGALRSPVESFKLLAYAYILLRHKGYPAVFYRDYYDYGYGDAIRRLIEIRNAHAGGAGLEHDETDKDVYVFSREGDDGHSGLVLLLNDGAAAQRTVKTSFADATLVDATGQVDAAVKTDAAGTGVFPVPERGYAVWVPEGK